MICVACHEQHKNDIAAEVSKRQAPGPRELAEIRLQRRPEDDEADIDHETGGENQPQRRTGLDNRQGCTLSGTGIHPQDRKSHTHELQSLMRISYSDSCLNKKKK